MSPAHRKAHGRSRLTLAAYPGLWLLGLLTIVLVLRLGLDPGASSFVFLLLTATYLGMLERQIPYEPVWHPSASEWRCYGIYFVLTMVGGASAQAAMLALFSTYAPSRPSVLPVWAEVVLALLLSSLVSYAVHRLAHNHPWLWRLHGVHHAPNKVNVANNGVNHVIDVVLAQFAIQSSVMLLGFSANAVFVAGIFTIAQGYFIHANIDVRLGWLNHILASPEQHRLHHSRDQAEAGHYGSDLSIWDHLFGSFTWYPQRRPAEIGLEDPATFPETPEIVSSQLHPWRLRRPQADRPL